MQLIVMLSEWRWTRLKAPEKSSQLDVRLSTIPCRGLCRNSWAATSELVIRSNSLWSKMGFSVAFAIHRKSADGTSVSIVVDPAFVAVAHLNLTLGIAIEY